MFDHVSIGVADIPRARTFYDEALKPLGPRPIHRRGWSPIRDLFAG